MTESWYKTSERLPPDDQPVEVQSITGLVIPLCYKKKLWWKPDMKSHVYYTPQLWRPIK